MLRVLRVRPSRSGCSSGHMSHAGGARLNAAPCPAGVMDVAMALYARADAVIKPAVMGVLDHLGWELKPSACAFGSRTFAAR